MLDLNQNIKFKFKKQRKVDEYLIKINSVNISTYETEDLNGTSYVKIPLRSSAILNIQNNNKYCFIWSILA